jgi:hypothetical protein
MAAPTFSQALEHAEVLARHALPTVLHERLSCAVALVRHGKVLQGDDSHTWEVESGSKPDVRYSINGHGCQCEDATYRAPQGRCKHVLATLLARKALALLHAPQEDDIRKTAPTDHATGPVASHETPVVSESPTPPLPEAPASVNVHITIAGRQCQLTLRDTGETRLLARLQAVLEQFPLGPSTVPADAQRPQDGWCTLHQVAMHQTTKHGKSWYSHKLSDGSWCKGRVRR